ncbi:unnamed protein product [Somion occarium]|uniref:C2H2-type domain-containing protein n=1 Tax=Somion occarium TaxID=3059160 RepID=A0ABP1E206_9APHY
MNSSNSFMGFSFDQPSSPFLSSGSSSPELSRGHYLYPDSDFSSPESISHGDLPLAPDTIFECPEHPLVDSYLNDDAFNDGTVNPADLFYQDQPYNPPPVRPRGSSLDGALILAPEFDKMHLERHALDSPSPSSSPSLSPSPRTSRRTRSSRTSTSYSGESDTYSSDGDDGEYRPRRKSSRLVKQAAYHPYGGAYASSRSSRTPSPALSLTQRPEPYIRTTSRRSLQCAPGEVLSLDLHGDHGFQCTKGDCNYVQKNERIPDLKRHIRAHQGGTKIICCGQPIGPDHPHWADGYLWEGKIRWGGCWRTFSRKDALTRHLNTQCCLRPQL